MSSELAIQLLCAYLGSFAFAVIFNIHGAKLVTASLGGLLAWGIYLALKPIIPNEVGLYFCASTCAAIYANIMARLQKAPVIVFFVPAMVPLIPGSGLYYSMHDALYSDWADLAVTGTHTVALAVAIVSGIVLTTSFNTIMHAMKKRSRAKRAVEAQQAHHAQCDKLGKD